MVAWRRVRSTRPARASTSRIARSAPGAPVATARHPLPAASTATKARAAVRKATSGVAPAPGAAAVATPRSRSRRPMRVDRPSPAEPQARKRSVGRPMRGRGPAASARRLACSGESGSPISLGPRASSSIGPRLVIDHPPSRRRSERSSRSTHRKTRTHWTTRLRTAAAAGREARRTTMRLVLGRTGSPARRVRVPEGIELPVPSRPLGRRPPRAARRRIASRAPSFRRRVGGEDGLPYCARSMTPAWSRSPGDHVPGPFSPTGSVTLKVEPIPDPLVTASAPPCASTIALQIARPRPVPLAAVSLAYQYRSNTRATCAPVMPQPLSDTSIVRVRPRSGSSRRSSRRAA